MLCNQAWQAVRKDVIPTSKTTDVPARTAPTVMAGLDPAICRGTLSRESAAIDGRVRPGHDGWKDHCKLAENHGFGGLV